MIVGIGVDVVDVPRFEKLIARTPALVERLFCPEERQVRTRSLAARFAAKEAVVKALGSPGGMVWHDCEVCTLESGAPELAIRGSVKEVADQLGVKRWHVSLTHDGDVAIAYVIAEG